MRYGYRRFWPDDRITQADAMRSAAKKNGLSMSIKNHGGNALVFYISFSRRGHFLIGFFNLEAASAWLANFQGGVNADAS